MNRGKDAKSHDRGGGVAAALPRGENTRSDRTSFYETTMDPTNSAARLSGALPGRNPLVTGLRDALRTATALLLLPLLVACGDSDSGPVVSRNNPVVPVDTGTVFIESGGDSFQLSVEIAETPNQRQIGLMERRQMPEDEGMIFLHYEESDASAGFWMFRTRIPLDIAYLDRDGTIVSIREMEPCSSQYITGCPTYAAGAPFWGALEVNAGYFASRGIGVGDRVTLRRGGRVQSLTDSITG